MARDHPRGCGENHCVSFFSKLLMGSPPRMRGKRTSAVGGGGCAGITPADAGKTLSDVDRDGNKKDHPRGCGENCSGQAQSVHPAGSPPRMRGKLPSGCGLAVSVRITPADAGKTLMCLLYTLSKYGSPPRMRGKLSRLHPRASSAIGSPPRMRGKPNAKAREVAKFRITPADAGKTDIFMIPPQAR